MQGKEMKEEKAYLMNSYLNNWAKKKGIIKQQYLSEKEGQNQNRAMSPKPKK